MPEVLIQVFSTSVKVFIRTCHHWELGFITSNTLLNAYVWAKPVPKPVSVAIG